MTTALEGGEGSVSRIGLSLPPGRGRNHCTGRWVGPRAGLLFVCVIPTPLVGKIMLWSTSERVWSTGGILVDGAKPNYSEILPVPRCLPQITHGRLWDRTRIFVERGWVLTARAMARPAAVFFLQNYFVLKYKSKDSLSLNRLRAISI
jgi:hypothetical protein